MPEPRACGDRLNSLEEWKANADLTIWQLTEQVRILTAQRDEGRLFARDAETDRYVEFRRIIKVIGLTEVLAASVDSLGIDLNWPLEEGDWERFCGVLYRRYGHLQFDRKPLWSKPPTVSDQTKAMIAEALRRR